MYRTNKSTAGIVIIILSFVFLKTVFAENLEKYVNAPDSAFKYKLIKTAYTALYTTYIFDVTSQEWHPDEVEPGKWKHWLRIIEPRLLGEYTENIPLFSLVKSDTALLYLLRGDAEHEDAPSGATFEEAQLALSTRSIVAELHGVPIGPVAFLDEQPDQDTWACDDRNPFKDDDECELLRSEDSLQARSFDLALSTGDFSWALMAPMTKAVVRSMDVIQEFLQQRYWGRQRVKEFVLTGHSKRGHIAWLAAALDSRVAAVVPVSYDLLNISEQIALQDASWPARSPEQDANLEFDLYNRYTTEIGTQLIADVDPYAYLDQLDIPALIMVGSGDPYSCSDAANLYIDDLPVDKRLFYIPNTGHDIREHPAVVSNTATFYGYIVKKQQLPGFTWSGLETGAFTVTPGLQKPVSAKLWTAANPVSRDFRQTEDNLTSWNSEDIDVENGTYSGAVPKPQTGFTAYYIELVYQGSLKKQTYSYATPITILRQ